MKKRLVHSIVFVLALVIAPGATARSSDPQRTADAPRTHTVELTGAALVDQMRCQSKPQVARAIDAMIKNRLINYVENESGVYLFEPTAPLTIFGLKIVHISGFDDNYAFKGVPNSTMVGTAPPVFLEIDVAAPASELRKRALAAGLIEGAPSEHTSGFDVSAKGWASYLAGKSRVVTSSIRCVK